MYTGVAVGHEGVTASLSATLASPYFNIAGCSLPLLLASQSKGTLHVITAQIENEWLLWRPWHCRTHPQSVPLHGPRVAAGSDRCCTSAPCGTASLPARAGHSMPKDCGSAPQDVLSGYYPPPGGRRPAHIGGRHAGRGDRRRRTRRPRQRHDRIQRGKQCRPSAGLRRGDGPWGASARNMAPKGVADCCPKVSGTTPTSCCLEKALFPQS